MRRKTDAVDFIMATSSFKVVNGSNLTIATTTSPYLLIKDAGVPLFLFIISLLVSTIVFVIGIFGNALVLIVFGSRCRKLKTCERYLVNLAVADLIASIVVPADKLYYIAGGHYEVLGARGCVCVGYLTITTFTVSSLTLVSISIDRYIVVKWPLRPRVTTSGMLHIFAPIWVIGSLPGIPYFFNDHVHLEKVQGSNRMVCGHSMTNTTHIIHTMVTFSMQVAVPLIIMTTTYVLIICELSHIQKSGLFRNQRLDTYKRFKQNKRTIKLLVVVVTLFFVCVAPVNIFYLLDMFNAHNLSQFTVITTFNILLMLQMLNSCVNPIIYSKLHTSFRRKSLKILCSCCLHKFKTLQAEASSRMMYASSRLSRFSKDLSAANERFMGRFSRSYSISASPNPWGRGLDDGLYKRKDSSCSTLESTNSITEFLSPIFPYKRNEMISLKDIIHEDDEYRQDSILLQQNDIMDVTEF